MQGTERKPNRLINEKSPYLLQHAHNPVDWYPWGREAFDKAKKENKPIFLSIGYSTCHYCHVMERESFEDDEIAALLNKDFVAVKVDREERPDIDSLYMAACQAMTGGGGWPLTILMTPKQEPFFAGTYIPKERTAGRHGLNELLTQISNKWRNGRSEVNGIATKIRAELDKHRSTASKGKWDPSMAEQAYNTYTQIFDEEDGGFGSEQKFPMPHNWSLMLAYDAKVDQPNALRMTEETLDAMWRGGIFDHIGYGFSRYSTDSRWLVPHFEKMLCDNAQLAILYTEAYQRTGNPLYRTITEQIFTYVEREMTDANGGFYSAEDADSEGVEGKFYVWTPQEVEAVLGAEAAQRFNRVYDITEEGNYKGSSIPNLINTAIGEIAAELGLTVEALEAELDAGRTKLYEARKNRVRPYKDDKILTGWNGLMIAALAFGAKAFGESVYAERAERAARFLKDKLVREDGRLLARYRDGDAAIPAFLDDHAYLLWGLNELYEATFNPEWLEWAQTVADQMIRLFGDRAYGAFFFTASDAEKLIIRLKETMDGAQPSGNSVAARQLHKLFRLTGEIHYRDWAVGTLDGLSDAVSKFPSAHAMILLAGLAAESAGPDVVITGDRADSETAAMIAAAQQAYAPHGTIVFVPAGDEGAAMREKWPHVADKGLVDGKPAAYVCRDFTCQAPVTSSAALKEQLGGVRLQ
ncbi:thioredoxin domain-containing protein [Paenibacillus sp. CCS19]|uniref:thioredoxin domain-containing protein n=1 Tax=Paenibacillus sp. CCS19 TaxID=3158387 RepID=UPI0025630311|nr:thioredoxin domain-containing protein [Paenibacillus cellulosilyticus]GMK41505.1 thioredoxin domain-containing protein [Paenibacillus cellulosilyticus]